MKREEIFYAFYSKLQVRVFEILANIEYCNSFQNSSAILPQSSPTSVSEEEDGGEEI